MGVVNKDNIREVMTYHAPSAEQVERMEKIREAAINLSTVILENAPPCADTTTAIRRVREARMDANAAIVLNGMV